jgi:hypothetical protein
MDAFTQILPLAVVEEIVKNHGPVKRRPPKLQHFDLFAGMVFHLLRDSGTLAFNVSLLSGIPISDSALSQRRANLPMEIFDSLMREGLRPKADFARHPYAFYKGMLLVGIDGSQFSVSNTAQNKKSFIKQASRRMKAAFGKLGVSVLMELGLHNPVAAVVGKAGESEQLLSQKLMDQLPGKSLLLADRAYGLGCWVKRIKQAYPKGDRDFLLRVRSNCKARVLEVLKDGSAWVEIEVEKEKIQLREIMGRVRRPGAKWTTVRLWTSLKDSQEYSAQELLELYGRRWEQEGGFRELKVDMRSATLVKSHTEETAAQEIAALILAQAILVEARIEIAEEAGVEVLRISFSKTLDQLESLWTVVAAAEGLLSAKQIQALIRRVLQYIGKWAIPPRRKRSCPRKLRQPVSSWPRLTKNTYQIGDTQSEIIKREL